MPPSSNPAPTGTPRPAIADLLKVPSLYRMTGPKEKPDFVLVNEKGQQAGPAIESEFGHTRDELILMIGAAYPEFVGMAKELMTAKQDYVAACDVIRATHQSILGGRAATADANPVEDAGKLRSRYNQSMDVMKNILGGTQNAEQIRFLIGRYVDMNRRLGIESDQPENAIPLVNENEPGASSATPSN